MTHDGLSCEALDVKAVRQMGCKPLPNKACVQMHRRSMEEACRNARIDAPLSRATVHSAWDQVCVPLVYHLLILPMPWFGSAAGKTNVHCWHTRLNTVLVRFTAPCCLSWHGIVCVFFGFHTCSSGAGRWGAQDSAPHPVPSVSDHLQRVRESFEHVPRLQRKRRARAWAQSGAGQIVSGGKRIWDLNAEAMHTLLI